MKLRVYIAGPYSASTPRLVARNVSIAACYAEMVMSRGHAVHCPHTATHEIAWQAELSGRPIPYERWLDLDLSILEAWATALFVIADSPGVRREIEAAQRKGIPIYRRIGELPEVKP